MCKAATVQCSTFEHQDLAREVRQATMVTRRIYSEDFIRKAAVSMPSTVTAHLVNKGEDCVFYTTYGDASLDMGTHDSSLPIIGAVVGGVVVAALFKPLHHPYLI